jgi:hypothetical protein
VFCLLISTLDFLPAFLHHATLSRPFWCTAPLNPLIPYCLCFGSYCVWPCSVSHLFMVNVTSFLPSSALWTTVSFWA